MKNYITLLFAMLIMVSCDEFENSADPSRVTYLAFIEIQGDDHYDFPCDAEGYTDEGAIATVEGQVVEHETEIIGTYFGSTTVDRPDIYQIVYSAANKDDVPGNAVRTIFWPECNGDMVTSIAGMYTSAVFRTDTADPGKGNTVNYSDKEYGPYFVLDLGGGKYQLSDAIGGFYEHGDNYGYGPAYAATGMVITANNIPLNDFTHDEVVGVGAFGGEAKITSFSVDPIAKTIEFTTEWDSGYKFDVVLTQVAE